jgi:hypothetical protein
VLEVEPQLQREAALPSAPQAREASTLSAEPSWVRASPRGARMQALRAWSPQAFPLQAALPRVSPLVLAEPRAGPRQLPQVFAALPVHAVPAHVAGAVS